VCFALHAVGDVEDAAVEILGAAILAIDRAAPVPYPFGAAALVNDPVFDREWRAMTDRLFDGTRHTVAVIGVLDAREAAWNAGDEVGGRVARKFGECMIYESFRPSSVEHRPVDYAGHVLDQRRQAPFAFAQIVQRLDKGRLGRPLRIDVGDGARQTDRLAGRIADGLAAYAEPAIGAALEAQSVLHVIGLAFLEMPIERHGPPLAVLGVDAAEIIVVIGAELLDRLIA